jgi:hypothetical protein
VLHRLICALLALFFMAAFLVAADYTGTVEKIDAKKGSLTIKMKDDKTKDFDISFRAKIFDKEGKESTGKKRLAVITKEASVTVTTETQKVGGEDKEVVTKVQINK